MPCWLLALKWFWMIKRMNILQLNSILLFLGLRTGSSSVLSRLFLFSLQNCEQFCPPKLLISRLEDFQYVLGFYPPTLLFLVSIFLSSDFSFFRHGDCTAHVEGLHANAAHLKCLFPRTKIHPSRCFDFCRNPKSHPPVYIQAEVSWEEYQSRKLGCFQGGTVCATLSISPTSHNLPELHRGAKRPNDGITGYKIKYVLQNFLFKKLSMLMVGGIR